MSVSNNGNMCWICFDSKSADIFQVEKNCEWPELFNFCIGEPIHYGDTVIKFCGKCALKLQDFGQFKKTCIKSNFFWKSCHENIKTNDDENSKDAFILKSENEDEYQCQEPESLHNDFSNEENNYNPIFEFHDVKNVSLIKTEVISQDALKHPVQENTSKAPKLQAKAPNRRNIFLCTKCGKTYSKKKWLLKHSKICLKKSKGKAFKKLESNSKVKTISKEPLKKFESNRDIETISKEPFKKFKSNSETISKEPLNFYCGICEFNSKKSHEVNEHYREHIANKELNCKLCPYSGKDVADMIYHRYNHYQHQTHKFICPDCNKRSGSRRSLQFHYRSVHLGVAGGWCFECNKHYKIFKSFKIHMRRHSECSFICDHCGYRTGARYLIVEHLRRHTNSKKYICDACGIGFHKHYDLKSHVYFKHTKIPKIKCTHCDKYFKKGILMNQHLASLKKKKPYVCEVCSKSFTLLSRLKRHSIMHQNERPHSCNFCDKKFKRQQQLRAHLSLHIGAKPHTCPQCDKSFLSLSSMKRHQAVHTGVRPVKCLNCDKTFYSKFQMLSHCKSKHKMEVVQK